MTAIATPLPDDVAADPTTRTSRTTLPTVLTHGMGDACENPGFAQLAQLISQRTGTPAVCMSAGEDLVTDTINTFLLTMNKQTERFAGWLRSGNGRAQFTADFCGALALKARHIIM